MLYGLTDLFTYFSFVKSGGCAIINSVQYIDGLEVLKRSRQCIWRAAVDMSKTASPLALQLRYLDLHVRWNERVCPEQPLQDGKGPEAEASAFRNACIVDKMLSLKCEDNESELCCFLNFQISKRSIMKAVHLNLQNDETDGGTSKSSHVGGLSNGSSSTVGSNTSDGKGSYLIFNVGDTLYISDLTLEEKDPVKSITFGNSNPVCHAFDFKANDGHDFLIGLNSGDVYSVSLRLQSQDVGKKLVGAHHYNKDGALNNSFDIWLALMEEVKIVGVAELKVAVEKTGGLVVLAESFGHSVFKNSLLRVFQSGDNDLGLSSNGIFEVNFSKDIRIQGILGPCASLEKKGPYAPTLLLVKGVQPHGRCVDLTNQDVIGQAANNQFYFQSLTYYQHSNGNMRLRATTLSRRWVTGPPGPGNIKASQLKEEEKTMKQIMQAMKEQALLDKEETERNANLNFADKARDPSDPGYILMNDLYMHVYIFFGMLIKIFPW
ncbi:catabolite repression protein creC [Artemisia annua]|uniref:Protein transport protein SEC23 n=1 Tax=Artemisia annua TaxID=35608 RepID=A0A2U1Q558_ARTAN|nr:catabolite repression protein creC [Artemisia annua]